MDESKDSNLLPALVRSTLLTAGPMKGPVMASPLPAAVLAAETMSLVSCGMTSTCQVALESLWLMLRKDSLPSKPYWLDSWFSTG